MSTAEIKSALVVADATDRRGNTLVLPGQLPDGQYILSVLLKRTYRFAHQQRCERAEKDRKIISGDQHYDDPMNSSVRFESDFVPYKLATDIVLNGRAYAPGEQLVQELVATLMVGDHRKDIYVVGDRVAQYRTQGDPVFTEPQLFKVMDIRYERAYGGSIFIPTGSYTVFMAGITLDVVSPLTIRKKLSTTFHCPISKILWIELHLRVCASSRSCTGSGNRCLKDSAGSPNTGGPDPFWQEFCLQTRNLKKKCVRSTGH